MLPTAATYPRRDGINSPVRGYARLSGRGCGTVRGSDPFEWFGSRRRRANVHMRRTEPALPNPRGPVSEALFHYLRGDRRTLADLADLTTVRDVLDDDDLQLALYCCYELHYRGFDLDRDLEWDERVLRLRRQMEDAFEAALRSVTPPPVPAIGTPGQELQAIIDGGGDGPSPSAFMEQHGSIEQMREFAIHRSLYQLKEADCHTWAIPRYAGRSRSALIEIQMDEYGNGVPGESHAELFADTMRALGLDPTYGASVDLVGAPTLATTNLISWFGLHRRLLPALLGHLAVFEMTSVVPMARYSRACDRLGLPNSGRRFYDVHVEADEHHGPLAATHLVGDFVADAPATRPLVMWGAATLMELERRLATHLVEKWTEGESSLRAVGSVSHVAA